MGALPDTTRRMSVRMGTTAVNSVIGVIQVKRERGDKQLHRDQPTDEFALPPLQPHYQAYRLDGTGSSIPKGLGAEVIRGSGDVSEDGPS